MLHYNPHLLILLAPAFTVRKNITPLVDACA